MDKRKCSQRAVHFLFYPNFWNNSCQFGMSKEISSGLTFGCASVIKASFILHSACTKVKVHVKSTQNIWNVKKNEYLCGYRSQPNKQREHNECSHSLCRVAFEEDGSQPNKQREQNESSHSLCRGASEEDDSQDNNKKKLNIRNYESTFNKRFST